MLQMYPQSVGIYFARTAGGAATPADPIPMFGGIIETFEGSSAGMVTLGFNEIQSSLDSSMNRSDLLLPTLDQTVIEALSVDLANENNITYASVDAASSPVFTTV